MQDSCEKFYKNQADSCKKKIMQESYKSSKTLLAKNHAGVQEIMQEMFKRFLHDF